MDMKTKHKEVHSFLHLRPCAMRDKALIKRNYPEMLPKINAAYRDGCVGFDKLVVWWKC